MKIRILESAKMDLKEGFWFYEKQDTGLGTYYLDTLYADIDSLRLYGGIHSIHFGNYHRMLSSRFPFARYYRISERHVDIHAVIDCRKDPAWIRKRLS